MNMLKQAVTYLSYSKIRRKRYLIMKLAINPGAFQDLIVVLTEEALDDRFSERNETKRVYSWIWI